MSSQEGIRHRVGALKRQLLHLRAEHLALREEVCALRQCLEAKGIVSLEQVSAQVHKQRFDAMWRYSSYVPEAHFQDVLQSPELIMNLRSFGDESTLCALLATSGLCRETIDNAISKVYVCGGLSANGSLLNSVESFGLFHGTWEICEDLQMPFRRAGAGAAMLYGSLYLCGGAGELGRTATRLDLKNRKWQAVAPLSTQRNCPSAAVLEGRLYVVGGHDGSWSHNSMEMLDPRPRSAGGKPTWQACPATMSEARTACASAGAGRLLVVCGGDRWPTEDTRPTASAEAFDPVQGSWAALPEMPVARVHHAAARAGRMIYVCGGVTYEGTQSRWVALSSVAAFDFIAGTWSVLPPMLTPRQSPAMTVAGGRLYVFGGTSTPVDLQQWDGKLGTSAERYDVWKAVWEPVKPMLTPRVYAAAGAFG